MTEERGSPRCAVLLRHAFPSIVRPFPWVNQKESRPCGLTSWPNGWDTPPVMARTLASSIVAHPQLACEANFTGEPRVPRSVGLARNRGILAQPSGIGVRLFSCHL